jgi:UDP-N-acetylglucosamine--N-acetylmuramyl-(pentapeptide) pyrophosphoryl-undecaprenol N-acetylglucosamine transferase
VLQNWRLIPAMIGTFAGLSRLFLRLRPDLVVGTGGYASGPAGMWAVMTAVPVAVQEQNSHPGFTTRQLSRWARQVHLGFPEAATMLSAGKNTEVYSLGNPIRPPDSTIEGVSARQHFGLSADATVLLVVGGSQGSRAINQTLLSALEMVAAGTLSSRPPRLEILWATGPTHIESVRERLNPLGLGWVKALGYIDAMPNALAAMDVAVSRAGAMATAELLAWGRPMLLVPLPTAAADHQTHNAKALEQAGAALMVREPDLTPEGLWRAILSLTADEERLAAMQTAARLRAQPNAARDIAEHLYRLIAS